ncbi:MAG: peptidyl-tRNA hydrolase, family [Thermoanaerobacterium sp.]|uniref:Peptidyl-tRNA hydrolase n=1 Tax=Thermoanaerobacterium butyriciformans TaxID=1702242 RepID=A0ABS4NF97_9THEO|nr:aminoacyl-tRNA hydrolase [Thermoanaerobacterium butyriciformans]MBP2072339.1 PTH1 family peptidyl-tRNA hydrolase [Thermoanaerobacterium butyriciformans]MDI3478642.1 peptidyl-tRNA hydrolase, family [Thermoanaerobacterium sp.]MDN5316479.1 peptidyl-tRNA hydrolase, family [Thermoanaerobacterium sp.]
MYIIVGLGNPGREYEGTRHNMGFDVIDNLSAKLNIDVKKLRFKSLIGEGIYKEEKVILQKPQTYMNSSGEAVYDIVNFYKLPLSNLIVVYDDKDLDVGKIRIRKKGSSGGHNGMKSIIYLLNSEDFPRVRVGIGKPKGDMIEHVLGRFDKSDKLVVDNSIDKAADAIIDIIENGVEHAMNLFNGDSKCLL